MDHKIKNLGKLLEINNNEILDSLKIKDSLCSEIFDNDDNMLVEVRDKLLEISNDFLEFLGIDFFVHDVILTGSLSNYNWSEYSDVDLHIIIDFAESEYGDDLLKEFFESKRTNWNQKHNIKIKGFDVEIYVQDIDEHHESSGIYSVLKNKWLMKPNKSKNKLDLKQILTKTEYFEKQIDRLVDDYKNGGDVIDKIDKLKERLKKFRKCGLSKIGEYSYENLTFKVLRRNGYIKKLLDMKTKMKDKKLSLKQ